jgi:hypothetical protein
MDRRTSFKKLDEMIGFFWPQIYRSRIKRRSPIHTFGTVERMRFGITDSSWYVSSWDVWQASVLSRSHGNISIFRASSLNKVSVLKNQCKTGLPTKHRCTDSAKFSLHHSGDQICLRSVWSSLGLSHTIGSNIITIFTSDFLCDLME